MSPCGHAPRCLQVLPSDLRVCGAGGSGREGQRQRLWEAWTQAFLGYLLNQIPPTLSFPSAAEPRALSVPVGPVEGTLFAVWMHAPPGALLLSCQQHPEGLCQ